MFNLIIYPACLPAAFLFCFRSKKEAKKATWGLGPQDPPDEGLAVLGGEGVGHRKAFLHVLLWMEPLFYCDGQCYYIIIRKN